MIELIGPTPTIETRKGRPIQLEKGIITREKDVERDRAFYDSKYNDPTKIRKRKDCCAQYNCHGLTFLNRRAFLKPQHIEIIIEDDDYFVINESEVKPGDIAIYYGTLELDGSRGIIHTAIVTWIETPKERHLLVRRIIWVVSKWGEGPEYIHHSSYGPYDACNINYMREGQYDRPENI